MKQVGLQPAVKELRDDEKRDDESGESTDREYATGPGRSEPETGREVKTTRTSRRRHKTSSRIADAKRLELEVIKILA